eukprot:m.119933 g.119933  ORF g.119933 m.119933 type:complete len:745 (-) comp9567_c0_seq1:25-2259(-)
MLRSSVTRITILGKGAFGRVYLVKDRSSGQRMAAKVIPSICSDDSIEKVLREIDVLKRLHHPNVIQMIDFTRDEKGIVIYMDYADHGDLEQLISRAAYREEILPECQVFELLAQLLAAVHHLHQQHIIHRDIKPSNILLTSSGLLKLGDFGFARIINGGIKASRKGTPLYMAPEEVSMGHFNEGGDIWALGCVLYEMATSRSPFEDATSYDHLEILLTEGNYAPVPATYSESVGHLVDWMLTRKANKRPRAAELLEHRALRAWYKRLAVQNPGLLRAEEYTRFEQVSLSDAPTQTMEVEIKYDGQPVPMTRRLWQCCRPIESVWKPATLSTVPRSNQISFQLPGQSQTISFPTLGTLLHSSRDESQPLVLQIERATGKNIYLAFDSQIHFDLVCELVGPHFVDAERTAARQLNMPVLGESDESPNHSGYVDVSITSTSGDQGPWIRPFAILRDGRLWFDTDSYSLRDCNLYSRKQFSFPFSFHSVVEASWPEDSDPNCCVILQWPDWYCLMSFNSHAQTRSWLRDLLVAGCTSRWLFSVSPVFQRTHNQHLYSIRALSAMDEDLIVSEFKGCENSVALQRIHQMTMRLMTADQRRHIRFPKVLHFNKSRPMNVDTVQRKCSMLESYFEKVFEDERLASFWIELSIWQKKSRVSMFSSTDMAKDSVGSSPAASEASSSPEPAAVASVVPSNSWNAAGSLEPVAVPDKVPDASAPTATTSSSPASATLQPPSAPAPRKQTSTESYV